MPTDTSPPRHDMCSSLDLRQTARISGSVRSKVVQLIMQSCQQLACTHALLHLSNRDCFLYTSRSLLALPDSPFAPESGWLCSSLAAAERMA
eukprot:5143308-Amphidinium_carterae.1